MYDRKSICVGLSGAIGALQAFRNKLNGFEFLTPSVQACMDAMQLIEKSEEVVRCKDCKHYRINTVYPGTNMIMTYCAKTGIAEIKPDWYCADGERRTDDA